MSDEDRWAKLEQIITRVVENALDSRGLTAKTKLGFANGKWTGVTEHQLSAWKAAYGSVDIQDELNKMAAWIVSNPMAAPKNNFARFANTWLSRCQDRSAIRSIPTRSEVETKRKHCAYCPNIATGSVGGVWACSSHMSDAMEGKPQAHMWGVVAKNVAGDR